jgi:hypothetical protein
MFDQEECVISPMFTMDLAFCRRIMFRCRELRK